MYSKIITQVDLATLVTLDEAKKQCRISHAFDDDYITSLIAVSAELAQTYTRRALTPATVTSVVDEHQRYVVQLPYGDVTDVTEVLLDDVATTDFEFEEITQKLTVNKSYSKLKATYNCGYATGELPAVAKHGILLTISTLYNNREDFVTGNNVYELPMTSRKVLDAIKYYGI